MEYLHLYDVPCEGIATLHTRVRRNSSSSHGIAATILKSFQAAYMRGQTLLRKGSWKGKVPPQWERHQDSKRKAGRLKGLSNDSAAAHSRKESVWNLSGADENIQWITISDILKKILESGDSKNLPLTMPSPQWKPTSKNTRCEKKD